MSLRDLVCPGCKTAGRVKGLGCNKSAILWCVECSTFTQGPEDEVVAQWKAGRRISYGKPQNPTKKEN